MPDELKPKLRECPFCGGEVSISLTGDGLMNWLFITRGNSKTKKNCNCRLFMESEKYSIWCEDSKEAASKAMKDLFEAWNRRVGEENKPCE